MWFVFPQIAGLGFSSTANFYAIKSLEEAGAYLAHPLLGARLLECCEIVLAIEDRSAGQIFGFPDELKFRSCMTLFACVAGPASVFEAVLQKYFDVKPDRKTLELLEKA